MSNSVNKTSVLQRLGDDWHNDNVYFPLIQKILPETKYTFEIQEVLYAVYVQEHYNFKVYKHVNDETFYSDEVSEAEQRIKVLEQEMKKEGKIFESLAEKFEQYQQYLTYTSQENNEEEEEDDYVANPNERGKGNRVKTNAKKLSPQEAAKILEEKKNTQIAQNTKSAMATSQQKLLDMQEEMETLERKKEYYKHYHYAEHVRQCMMRKLVLAYEKDQNIENLVRGLDDLLGYYNMMRRRYVPTGPCEGSFKELCKTHMLPLGPPFLSEKGVVLKEPQCCLTPVS